MNFWEAVKFLKFGNAIRREAWPQNSFLQAKRPEGRNFLIGDSPEWVLWVDGKEHGYSASCEDVFAGDWYISNEKKQK